METRQEARDVARLCNEYVLKATDNVIFEGDVDCCAVNQTTRMLELTIQEVGNVFRSFLEGGGTATLLRQSELTEVDHSTRLLRDMSALSQGTCLASSLACYLDAVQGRFNTGKFQNRCDLSTASAEAIAITTLEPIKLAFRTDGLKMELNQPLRIGRGKAAPQCLTLQMDVLKSLLRIDKMLSIDILSVDLRIITSRKVHLLELRPSVQLPSHYPFHLVEPNAVNQWSINLIQLLTHAKEVVKPEQPTRPKHPIDVKKHEVQQCRRYPVTQHMHRVHNVQRVIEEGKSLRNAYVERHDPP
ncbi:hypothetical protein RJ640_003764 [Escallonia rubra]|uniref:Uncharacterized protein n=1 Tax=Escallonia rubra TaxID=112253 RepID=A0AA88QRQ2_9ASTE|nr:hypothetical protein RJ640_003764 [Escallonia rubra]